MSELRWNPLLREWVVTAVHRQTRPVLGTCPFCTGSEKIHGGHETVAIPNRYPALLEPPPRPFRAGRRTWKIMPSRGHCEVILYSPDHTASLASLPIGAAERVIRLWRQRFLELGAKRYVRYVHIFENRGRAVGVTLSHPHGQLYALPFIPPVIRREMGSFRSYRRSKGACLLCNMLEAEIEDGSRLVVSSGGFAAYVPFWARWPYEVHIVPEGHYPSLAEVDESLDGGMASALRRVLAKYDNLMGSEMPYVLVLHQRPVDSADHSYFHLHVEIYPFKRSAQELKYLAGTELGAGVFLNDTHPEEIAEELRRAPP